MAIVKTHLYNISFQHEDLMKILIKLDQYKKEVFPQSSKKIAGQVKGVSVMDNANPYNEPLDDLYHLFDCLNLEKGKRNHHYEEVNLIEVNELIRNMNEDVEHIAEIKENIEKEKEENLEAIDVLNNMVRAKISLDDIGNTNYITIRFGKVPVSEYSKIKYFREYQFIWRKLSESSHYVWLVYCGLNKNISEIDNIFYSMNFEPVKIPDFAHGGVNEAIMELQNEINAMDQYIEEVDKKLIQIREERKDELLDTFVKVASLKHLYDQCQYVVDFSHKAAIYAFSIKDLEGIKEVFKDIENVKVMELPVNIYIERGIVPPVIVKNNFVVRPFEKILSAHVGDTFDAATLLAIVMMLTCALLLGDFGIGVLLIVLGLLFGIKKGNSLSGILECIGASILIGGFLSGKAFVSMTITPQIFVFTTDMALRVIMAIGIIVATIVILMVIKKLTRKKATL